MKIFTQLNAFIFAERETKICFKLFAYRILFTVLFLGVSSGIQAQDWDMDGIVDSVDLDNDNDGIPDAVENGDIVFMQPDCSGIAAIDFSMNSVLESGTDLMQGAVYRFSNVQPGVDAILTLQDLVNATIVTIDQNGTDASFLKPEVIYNLPSMGDVGYVEYIITFVESGTLNQVILNEAVGNFIDIDGNNQYQEIDRIDIPSSYTLSNPREFTVEESGSYLTITGGTTEYSNIQNTNSQVNVAAYYEDITAFTIRFGTVSSSASPVTTVTRQHGIQFSCLTNYNNPETLFVDQDGDGIANSFDLDSDNDGIYDVVEAGNASLDGNNDGMVDGAVGNNGIPDAAEDGGVDEAGVSSLPNNTDGDSLADYLDTDSDGDGCSDVLEGGSVDSNGDGYADGNIATNGTVTGGAYTDPVSTDVVNIGPDSDGDGIFDACDDDFGGGDNDNDGIPDSLDLDNDNDGIPDDVENGDPIPGQPDCSGIEPLDFGSTPTLESGTDLSVGATYRFANVRTNIDALLVISEIVNASIVTVDQNSSDPAFLKPEAIYTLPVNGSQGYVQYDISFVLSGTNNAVILDEAIANFIDIDGNTEYQEIDRLGTPFSYTLSNPHDFEVYESGNFLIIQGGMTEYSNIQNTNDQVNVSTYYKDKASFSIRFGAISSSSNPVTTVTRQHGIDFGCLTNYTNPETTGLDTDGDGIANAFDLDSDNDGIYDVVENGNGLLDTNNDGMIDGPVGTNGIPDAAEDGGVDGAGVSGSPLNSDSDTIPNYLDMDSDNDGITDNVESQTTTGYVGPSGMDSDNNGVDDNYDTNGTPIVPFNFDGTDEPDYLDSDSDNDTVPDAIEGHDFDHDGMADVPPSGTDSDNDGLDDAYDGDIGGYGDIDGLELNGDPTALPDTDGTEDVDFRDIDDDGDAINTEDEDVNGDGDPTNDDSDNDGIPDYLDPLDGVDTDGDGVLDDIDLDDDNDGILDTTEGTEDSDGDGIINSLDIDADNDGIPDNVEAQTTDGYVPPSGLDDDNDGLDNAYEGNGDEGIDPVNFDGADLPDYLDNDSDNDNVPDYIEGNDFDFDGQPDVIFSGTDADGDGLDDAYEGSDINDGFDVNDEIENPASDLPDTDGTEDVNYRDIDDDGDTILTSEEDYDNDTGDGDPTNDDSDGDGIPDYLDPDDDNDGIPTSDEDPDPNGDGNPDDALDSDEDDIPDYLDPVDDGIQINQLYSPNGDFTNDILFSNNINNFSDNTVQIFNRWGVKVWETRGYNNERNAFIGESDGRATIKKEELLPVGIYYIILQYVDGNGKNIEQAGFFYLSR